MKKKIWITKNWVKSCTIFIWTRKPVWYPNKNLKNPGDNGHWAQPNDGGLKHSSCRFHDDLDGLFKVKFSKKRCEGFIAERILTIRLPK